ncbi:MAG: PEP-CTERM sorting domain-containing protein [Lacipirellulaceae bacterium]
MKKQPIQILKLAVSCAILVAVANSTEANAIEVWSQGFETDTAGWLDDDDFAGFGDASRVPSGTGGIASNEGSFHGLFADDAGGTGPFTRFDGYRDTWTGGFTASIDVYLDTNWANGEGFDYSVAANGSDGDHQRDFVFHVTKDTSSGDLLVGGSNNTNFAPREDLETIDNYSILTTGWYTLEHVFRDAGDGTLAVDLNLRDSGGALLFTETRNDGSDVIATEVGGNRYGWFTDISVSGGINVDGHTLSVIPEPTALALAGLGVCGLALGRRRKQ